MKRYYFDFKNPEGNFIGSPNFKEAKEKFKARVQTLTGEQPQWDKEDPKKMFFVTMEDSKNKLIQDNYYYYGGESNYSVAQPSESAGDKLPVVIKPTSPREAVYACELGGIKNLDDTISFNTRESYQEFKNWQAICNTPYNESLFSEIPSVVAENALFLDTETTGMSENDEVIELGIVDARGKEVFHKYFKPTVKIAEDAEKVHHIKDIYLSHEREFIDSWMSIREILKGKPLFIFNRAFDKRMILQTLRKFTADEYVLNNAEEILSKANDALKDAEIVAGKRISLNNVCKLLGFNYDEKHSASCDAYMTLMMYHGIDNKMKGAASKKAGTVTDAVSNNTPEASDTRSSSSNDSSRQKTQRFTSIDALMLTVERIVSEGGEYVGHVSTPTGSSLLIYKSKK